MVRKRWPGCALAFAIAVAGLAAFAAPASADGDAPTVQQKIALTAKPSVVRVFGAYIGTFSLDGQQMKVAIGGTGTGWFITPDGYIATNAHVVSDIHAGDEEAKHALLRELIKEARAKSPEIARLNETQLAALLAHIKLVDADKLAYVVLPNGDKLPYEISQYGKPGSGRDVAIIKVKIDNAPTLPIGDSTKSQVEDRVVVIGYPGVADFKDLLDEKSQLEASTTDGAVSSLKRAASGEQILQISAPITHGNSGGPAIDQHGNVVGLATFGNEGDVQGFNFLVASATLLDMIHDAKDAKIEPKPSETNTAWRAGLDHFWADEYSDAIASFEEVETLFPRHSDAQAMIIKARQAKKDGKEKAPARTGLVVGLVIGGVVLALIAVVMVRRGRPAVAGARPLAPPQPMPPGYPPPQAPPIQQMYGRVAPAVSAQQPIAKTVAIGGGSGGYPPTAFAAQSIGSLTCTRGQLYGQRFALTATGLVIGRQPGVAHVLVNDHRASGKHVWIGVENGQLVAIDQGTTNGTYVNDPGRGRITRAELRDGDVVIVGEPDCLSLQLKIG